MIAYPKNLLEAIKIIPACNKWEEKKLLNLETLEKIKDFYKNELYMPNIFIRIGLFIFTCILVSSSLGLLTLIFQGADSETSIAIKLMIYGILVFIALEYFIKKRKTYRAGIDDALLYCGLGLFLTGLCILITNGNYINDEIIIYIAILPFLIASAIRYADMLLTALAFCCIFILTFLLLNLGGKTLQSLLPFAGMLLSGSIYYFKKKFNSYNYLVWWDNLMVVEILSLLTFYLSGNYLVVRELSIMLLEIDLQEGKDIPLAFVFYGFTILIPILYIYRSIQTKDKIMLRCGLLIFALGVLTFKYYYSLGHHEITLTLSGIIMIGTAYMLMKYLKTPKAGFTSAKDDGIDTDLESLIVSKSLGTNTTEIESGFKFGGGSSGGAGAGGQY